MPIRSTWLLVAAVCAAPLPLPAQKEPAVRPLGPITHVSTEPMATVTTAVALSDGRVYVNDVASRRILLFDSTLSTAKVVADSTSVTAKAYGARPGGLLAYRGDSALFVDPASSSMPVLSPKQSDRFAATLYSPPETWMSSVRALRNGITPGSSR